MGTKKILCRLLCEQQKIRAWLLFGHYQDFHPIMRLLVISYSFFLLPTSMFCILIVELFIVVLFI